MTVVEYEQLKATDSVVERDLLELNDNLESYRQDPDLQSLIKGVASDRGIDLPDECFDSEGGFLEAAQAALDFRKGGLARHDIKPADLSPETLAALDGVIDRLQMREETFPTNVEFDVAVVLGAAGVVPRKRADYLTELREMDDVRVKNIVYAGCERPVDMKSNASGQTEVDRAGSAGRNQSGEPIKTEFDLMRNTAANVHGISDAEWQIFEGSDSRVPEGFRGRYTIAHARKGGLDVFVTSAPMIGDERFYPDGNRRPRANTDDSLQMIAEMLKNGGLEAQNEPDQYKALIITDAVFNRFQGADAKGALAPHGVEAETVGYSREHAGLPDWPGGNAYYIQEVLSTLRQTRNARDLLQRKVSASQQS